ncbi:MAG: 2TM domain-containing protein [Alphaproteobacteria bacterium]|nr:2TM domain-containing protein [Alphaproteobacteria bacterium]
MQKEEEIRRKVKILRRFYMDIINFAIVNAILILIWLTFDRTGTFWPKYVILIWGILLVFKAYRMGTMSLIFPHSTFLSHEWEEKKIREMLRKQNRHPKSPPPKKEKKK